MTTAADIADRELDAAIRALLAMRDGKRVLYWVLELAAMYQRPFTGDAATTNFALGRQEVGRMVLERMDAIHPELYPQLLLDIAAIREVDKAAAKSLTENQRNEDDDDDAP